LKTAGAAGIGSVFASSDTLRALEKTNAATKEQKPKYPQVPKRKLGKTNIKVPSLSFGTFMVDLANQILLRKTLQHGINLWDTAYNYGGGNSEIGIGKFLSKNPEVRKNILLGTKASGAAVPADIEKRLQKSLKRLKTDYIDLFYGIHQCYSPAYLTKELRAWVEDAKERKLIRLFGVSTHQNMTELLNAAARLDWIDFMMIPFNVRLMQDKKLNAAIDASHKAGTGLIAMKTQGFGPRTDVRQEEKLIQHFQQRGFTRGQAKLKFVLEDKRFSSACVGMQNVTHLNSNVAAVLDKTKLTHADMQVLNEYARAACTGYCAGCAHICDSALPDTPYVSDIMRYLMYYNSYGERGRARELFAQIPGKVRNKLLSTDYSPAEARCPQHLPIGRLVAEAVKKLA